MNQFCSVLFLNAPELRIYEGNAILQAATGYSDSLIRDELSYPRQHVVISVCLAYEFAPKKKDDVV